MTVYIFGISEASRYRFEEILTGDMYFLKSVIESYFIVIYKPV